MILCFVLLILCKSCFVLRLFYDICTNRGAIQSAIQSIEMLCVQDGEVKHYQIEPKNGIHSGKKEELFKKEIVLINDDETFSNVVTSMGCYGVIVRVFISMEDAYYLTEHREKVKFKDWEKRYDEICSNGDVYVFEIWGNPYEASLVVSKSMVFTWWVKSNGPPADQENMLRTFFSFFCFLAISLFAFLFLFFCGSQTH